LSFAYNLKKLREKILLPVSGFFKNNHIKIILFLIITAYFLIGINQTVPFNSVDEDMLARWSWEMYENPFPVLLYPPLFVYLHFMLSIIYKFFFVLLGVSGSSAEFIYSGEGFRFMMEAGRFINVLAGSAILYTIYRTGKRFWNEQTGIMAVSLIAFNPVFILHSHIYKSDIILLLLIVLSLFFTLKFVETSMNRYLIISSLISGIAIAAKYNIIIYPVVLVAAILICKNGGSILKRFALMAISIFFGFLLSAPNWIVHPFGNLDKFLSIFINKGSTIFTLNSYSAADIFKKFIAGVFESLGTLYFGLLIISFISALIWKKKKSILMMIFILSYILFFGLSGFYGNRFLLPLLPFTALIISGTVLRDIRKLKLKPITIGVFKTVVWLTLLLFILNGAFDGIRKFNILRSGPKKNYVRKFRKDHLLNNKKFLIASQAFTPNFKGDIRFRKNFIIKSLRKINPSDIDFIQVNNTYKKVYFSIDNEKNNKRNKFINLNNFNKFYEIKRKKVQDWDDDYSFYYRQNPQLHGLKVKSNQRIILPKMFSSTKKWTMFPEGKYRKHPGFGISENTLYHSRIFSSEKINKLKLYIFFPGSTYNLDVRVNGKIKLVKSDDKRAEIKRIIFINPPVKQFETGYVYDLTVEASERKLFRSKKPVFYLIYLPEYEARKFDPIPSVLAQKENVRIGDIFKNEKLPGWLIRFYRETGIDLTLYKFMQTADYDFPPEGYRGAYYFYPILCDRIYVDIKGTPFIPDYFSKNECTLKVEIVESGKTGIEVKKYLFSGIPVVMGLKKSSAKFIRITPVNFRENNFSPHSVLIRPDFPLYTK